MGIGSSFKKTVRKAYKDVTKTVRTAGGDIASNIDRFGRATGQAVEDVGHAGSDIGHWADDNKGLIAGTLIGAATGGAGSLLSLGALGGAGIGASIGKTVVDDPAAEKYASKVAKAEADLAAREANTLSKQSLLNEQLSMTARRAMNKQAKKALRKNTPTSAEQNLGGEEQRLG